jgi:hypothetical protein
MQERDAFALGTLARDFVDESEAGGLAARQRALEVIDREADVMDALSPLGQEPTDRGIGLLRL